MTTEDMLPEELMSYEMDELREKILNLEIEYGVLDDWYDQVKDENTMLRRHRMAVLALAGVCAAVAIVLAFV